MLWLLDQTCEHGCIEARAKHVVRLTEAGFPDAALLEEQFYQISSHWSAGEMSTANIKAVANAEAWLEQVRIREASNKQQECRAGADCNTLTEAKQDATQRIAEAAQRLASN